MKRKYIILFVFLYPIIALGQNYKSKKIDSTYVFDKAQYHMESVGKDKLSDSQAFVHTGFFIFWAVDNGLVNDKFKEQLANSIQKAKLRQISPAALFTEMDGVFLGGILTLEGYNFAMNYFHLSNGRYLKDYEKLASLDRLNRSFYSVKDNWSNYEIVKGLLDTKYAKWR